MAKGRSTQSLVNTYPMWANVRTDEQSGGYQFFNAIGQRFDDLRKQVSKSSDNFFLATSNLSDIDVFYQFQLPGNFQFTKQDNDDTEFLFTPPTVSGIHNDVAYPVDIADENNIETFWYTPVPDRFTVETTTSGLDHILATATVNDSPLDTNNPSGILHIPNHIYVQIDGGTSYLGLEDQQIVRRGIVQIDGITREGKHLTEELYFVHDETLHTFHEFQSIETSGIRIYGVEPSTATVRVLSARFGENDYPVNYELDETVTGEDMPLFWALGEGTQSGVYTLDLKKFDIDELDLRLSGFVTKHTILQQELLDTVGSGITPNDLAVQPHSDSLWVVSDDTLYHYSAELPYGDMSQLQGKDYQASSVIQPSSYYVVLGDSVDLNYIWRRPSTGFVKHRVWVQKPDGTKKSLEAGAEVTYHTGNSSWIFGEPRERQIRGSESYVLDQRGDYIFSLEVYYTDETTSIDKRIVTVTAKQADAEYSFSDLGITTPVTGVDFDSEYKLWVIDANNVKYQLEPHYDKMLIDWERKVIYFREPYDKVRIF